MSGKRYSGMQQRHQKITNRFLRAASRSGFLFSFKSPADIAKAMTASRLRRRRVRDLMSLLPLFLPANRKRSSFALRLPTAALQEAQSKSFVGGWVTFYLRHSFQPSVPPPHPFLGGRRPAFRKLGKWFSRREIGSGFIWIDFRSSVVGGMKDIFWAGYRRESGFSLKEGCAYSQRS